MKPHARSVAVAAIALWAVSGFATDSDEALQDPAGKDPAEFESAALMALVTNLRPEAHWIGDEDRFWMKQETGDGARFVVVDAASGSRSPHSITPASRSRWPTRDLKTPTRTTCRSPPSAWRATAWSSPRRAVCSPVLRMQPSARRTNQRRLRPRNAHRRTEPARRSSAPPTSGFGTSIRARKRSSPPRARTVSRTDTSVSN